MTQTTQIQLTGLDPQDPLAYLASLGCLLAVSSQCLRAKLERPTMRFDLDGVGTPTLEGPFEDAEGLLDLLVADLDELAGRGDSPRDPFLTFEYPDGSDKGVHDLKPPPDRFREFAEEQIERASHDSRRTVDWAAAVLTDVAVDGNGGGKPFALHFTAGNQRFLNIALELLDGCGSKAAEAPVGREDLRAAVFGPWPNDRALKVFSWSPTQDRAYALRAENPADDKKLGTPGADWLALRGVGLLSSAPKRTPRGSSIQTSGVEGRWKSATFSYPIWTKPLDADAVRSLLRHPAVRASEAKRGTDRRTLPRGVEVLTCRISRSDQGGYGAFSRPSRR
ncbi:MAG: hypothetical protein R6X02_30500 [Enhygromyxa sp.]